MGVFRLSDELKQKQAIELENTFILEYMPFAPENYCLIYIFGKYAAYSDEADFDSIALALGFEKSVIVDAFEYWKKKELVNFCLEPLMIEYLPVKPLSQLINTYDPAKYKAFNDQLHILIKGRDIKPLEYDQYYNFMESYNFEDNALLMIIGYCIRLKGADIRHQYILTVAKSFAKEKRVTYDAVHERLDELELIDSDLCAVLKTLNVKRSADINDKNLFIKWKKEYGFKLETIIKVAKTVKKGGLKFLDYLLTKYHEKKLLTFDEIEDFENQNKRLFDLAKRVVKILGQKYDRLDYIIETIFAGWVALGYSDETLIEIAKLCTRINARELAQMELKIAELHKQKIISHESFMQYLTEFNKTDAKIKKILTGLGYENTRLITNTERVFYNKWINEFNMNDELIACGAEKAKGKLNNSSPLAYLNAIISSWHDADIKTVEDANKAGIKTASEVAATTSTFTNPDNFVKRNYSAEELDEMLNKYSDDEI